MLSDIENIYWNHYRGRGRFGYFKSICRFTVNSLALVIFFGVLASAMTAGFMGTLKYVVSTY